MKITGENIDHSRLQTNITGVVLFDGNGNILEADRNFLKMLKYDQDHPHPMTWDALTPPAHRELDPFQSGRIAESSGSGVRRQELMAKDGTRIQVLVNTASVGNEGHFVGLIFDAVELDRQEQDPQKLAGRLLNLYDEERRRIARELHDTTAQNLAALSMNLVMLSGVLADSERSRAILNECNLLTEECLKEIRSLSYMLHPPLLDELGLESALRAFISMFERRTGISVAVTIRNPIGRMDPQVELGVFRVAQESLFNVQRHSGSGKAELELGRGDRSLTVTIRDWGKGVSDGSITSDSVGIAGMRERVRLLGGQLDIGPSQPGTIVRAVFPVEP